MKTFFTELRAALASTAILAVLCAGLYPVAVWGIARLAFPRQAGGSLLRATDGRVLGSERVGQGFSGPRYFHPRPSAAGTGYDGAGSAGSNLGPTSARLDDLLRERIAAYRAANGLGVDETVPADAVTASGSGLDPHISLRNAALQAGRVARARGLEEARVRELVARAVDPAGFGFLGEPGVNVLRLNRALDSLR